MVGITNGLLIGQYSIFLCYKIFNYRLAAQGKKIIGWDDEWGVNWSSNTLNYGGAAAYQKLNRRHTKARNKIVLLMHDIAYRSPQASDELRTFVRLAKQSGYIFSTIDQYETDRWVVIL